MKGEFWFIMIGVIYIAILYMLVRPSSSGPALVTTVLNSIGDLVKGTTGYGQASLWQCRESMKN
jgi:hypothetical protein